MKKTFILLATIASALTVSAQSLIISNGEETNLGSWWAAGSAGAVDNWDNPAKDAVNGSDKAYTVWINNDNESFTGGGMGGLSVDIAGYNSISVMIFKQVAGIVQIELQEATAGEPNKYYLQKEYTTPGAWQKLDFFIPEEMTKISTILVAPHYMNYEENPIPDGEAHRMWWDEVVIFNSISTSIESENNDPREIISTQVYSLSGNLVATLGAGETVNASDLANGVYIIKELDSKGKEEASKAVKLY